MIRLPGGRTGPASPLGGGDLFVPQTGCSSKPSRTMNDAVFKSVLDVMSLPHLALKGQVKGRTVVLKGLSFRSTVISEVP